jgi:hypothetical protein
MQEQRNNALHAGSGVHTVSLVSYTTQVLAKGHSNSIFFVRTQAL